MKATNSCLFDPKPFEDEADFRRRCRATSSWHGFLGPRNDFSERLIGEMGFLAGNGKSTELITRRPLEKGWRYSLCLQ